MSLSCPRLTPPRLSALLHRIKPTPPSLLTISASAHYAHDYRWFQNLVRTYLPDAAPPLLRLSHPLHQLDEFIRIFSQRYFPLVSLHLYEYAAAWEGDDNLWERLRQGIPYAVQGFPVGDDRHLIWEFVPNGLCLLALLGDPADPAADADTAGIYVSWLEAAQAMVPRDLLTQLPAHGFAGDTLAAGLSAAGWPDCAQTLRYINATTGNFFLDLYGDPEWDETSVDPWEPEIIDAATNLWQEATRILDAVDRANQWLEQDPPRHFEQLLQLAQSVTTTYRESEA